MMKNKNQQKTRTLNILYSCFYFYLISTSVTVLSNVEIKFKNQTTRTYFF